MGQVFDVSTAHTGASPQRVEWTAKLVKVPVLAGVVVTPTSASPSLLARETSPLGTLFESSAQGPFVNAVLPDGTGFASGFEWDSAYGVPSLVTGEYHVTIAAENAVGNDPIQASDFIAYDVR